MQLLCMGRATSACKSQANSKNLTLTFPTLSTCQLTEAASYLFSYIDKLGQCTLVYFLVKASRASFDSFTLEKRVGYRVES